MKYQIAEHLSRPVLPPVDQNRGPAQFQYLPLVKLGKVFPGVPGADPGLSVQRQVAVRPHLAGGITVDNRPASLLPNQFPVIQPGYEIPAFAVPDPWHGQKQQARMFQKPRRIPERAGNRRLDVFKHLAGNQEIQRPKRRDVGPNVKTRFRIKERIPIGEAPLQTGRMMGGSVSPSPRSSRCSGNRSSGILSPNNSVERACTIQRNRTFDPQREHDGSSGLSRWPD
jgi:hypothetical protein